MAQDMRVDFKKNLPMISDSGSQGFSFSAPREPAVLLAIARNTPFPDKPISLAQTKLTTASEQPIVFANNGTDAISFSHRFGAFAAFGIYHASEALLAELPADEFVLPGFDFGLGAEEMLSAIRWGFAAEAKASGAMALGALGQATLKAEGSGQGLMATIRRLPKSMGARDVLQTTADNWRVPRQVHQAEDLDPGTWLLVDLLGGVRVKLGAQLGMDFNWVREIGIGELAGDIGLRLQLGISTAIGFQAGGKLALVVGRESEERKLRLRLIRLRSRQLTFAISAAATVDVRLPDLPRDSDDFIQAVFGVQSQQVLASLAAVEKWTDPKKKLSEILAQNAIDGAEDLIAFAAGVETADLQASFAQVHDRVAALTSKWRQLPQAVAANLVKALDREPDLAEVKAVASTLAQSDAAGVRKVLETQLSTAGFLDSPAGKYLESLADGPVLGLLAKPAPDIRAAAAQTLGVLDGSDIEDTLKRIRRFVEERLKVTQVLDAVKKTDFKALDGLLKRRLAAFLGKSSLDAADFEKLRTSVGEFLKHRQTFYEKALAALRRKYNFEVARTFQRKETDRALLDVTFDFSSDPAGVQQFFDKAIRGDFDFLFANFHPGISIGLGELTHGITRQTHTEVTLPFFRAGTTHVNQAIASARIEESDGRVMIYTVESSDCIANDERVSVLSLAMGLAAKGMGSPQLRIHQNKLELNYSLVYARRFLEKKHLLSRLRPLARVYFPRCMKSPTAYADFLEARTEEAIVNGPKWLGNALIALQVTMPSEAAAIAGEAWLALPADAKHAKYRAMGTAIRERLRAYLAGAYFTEAERFENRKPAEVLLVYSSLDPAVELDPMAKDQVKAELRKAANVERLAARLKAFQDVLADSNVKKDFRPADAAAIAVSIAPDDPRLTGMLNAERRIVDSARRAGVAIGTFVETAGEKPTEALGALAEFGANLTGAFHEQMVSMYVGDAIRAIGTELFLAATRGILDPARLAELPEEGAAAMLSIEFMKPELPFDERVLLARGRMTSAETILAERVVEA
jgi:hypothetical protein